LFGLYFSRISVRYIEISFPEAKKIIKRCSFAAALDYLIAIPTIFILLENSKKLKILNILFSE